MNNRKSKAIVRIVCVSRRNLTIYLMPVESGRCDAAGQAYSASSETVDLRTTADLTRATGQPRWTKHGLWSTLFGAPSPCAKTP